MSVIPHLYRHDSLVIPRPYGVDVDHEDWLWEGCGHELAAHNLRTAELRRYTLDEMAAHPAFQSLCWDGKIVITLGEEKFYVVFDPASGRARRVEIPGEKPIVWYAAKTPDGRALLFDRGNRTALLLDGPDATPRPLACPWACDFASGTPCSDGLIYIFVGDPARLIRLDPRAERFIDVQPLPWPQVGVSGRFEHDGILYAADSAGGQLLPLDLATQCWLDPIPTPGHGKLYGFIGLGFACNDVGFFCLSTYAHRSRLDLKTGKIILPPTGTPMTVDGRPPRFLDRFLTFNPSNREFGYVVAPAQPDGVPLLCYAWTDGRRYAITGTVLPFHEPGVVDATDKGAWLVAQSAPADRAPGFEPFDFRFDRKGFMAQRRRAYPACRSLYLPHTPHSPEIVNMQGPATAYPPGDDARLARRAANTDANAYWALVADRLFPRNTPDAAKVKLTLQHVKHHIYYNPIQVPQTFEPMSIHEAHEGRCGHAVGVTLAILRAAGVEARATELQNHVTAEAFYDHAWHHADALFFGGDQPARDGRVLSTDELIADPYFADAWPQDCFAYAPELTMSEDGYQVLGYVFGVWGSEPYYSFYLGAPKELPPTLPVMLPAQRIDKTTLRLNWDRSLKHGSPDGEIEYDVRVFADRFCTQELFHQTTRQTSVPFPVPEANRMYFAQVRAMDDHRGKNPSTWYPAGRWNFVLVPPEQYGWYGVL